MAILHSGLVTALEPGDPDDGDAGRRQRGTAIAAMVQIQKLDGGYRVPSQSGTGHYMVYLGGAKGSSCTCPDYDLKGASCKHIYASILVAQRERDPALVVDAGRGLTRAVRKTYPQNWVAYNQAQTQEKHNFLYLLRGLCDTVEQPPNANIGRPRMALSDMVFANVLKVYSGMSGRRVTGNIVDAEKLGLVDETPHFNSCYKYMGMTELTPILENLVSISATPLRTLETHFSPDSTGFSTGMYCRWFDEKHGKIHKETIWLKGHAMVGVNTNVVTAGLVTGPDANDGPFLTPLLDETLEHFDVLEVSADKAYLTRQNLQDIHDRGAVGYIPFKSNSVVRPVKESLDVIWNRAFCFFQLYRQDFLEHYHQRSNVETTFSMIKMKFGARVYSKTPVAQTNEILMKFLCHNICVLIMASFEHGIDPLFGCVTTSSTSTDGVGDLFRQPTHMPTPRVYPN